MVIKYESSALNRAFVHIDVCPNAVTNSAPFCKTGYRKIFIVPDSSVVVTYLLFLLLSVDKIFASYL